MTEHDVLIAQAELGEEARRFLESDLCKCMLGMAEQQVMAAQEELSDVDPSNTEKIRTLQNQVKLGRQFEEWLNELVSEGDNAIAVFRDNQHQG